MVGIWSSRPGHSAPSANPAKWKIRTETVFPERSSVFAARRALHALEKPQGIRFGDRIVSWGARPSLRVGPELLGRVIDAQGNPLDSLGEYRATRTVPIDGTVPLPLTRVPITEPLACGVRAIDGFVSAAAASA